MGLTPKSYCCTSSKSEYTNCEISPGNSADHFIALDADPHGVAGGEILFDVVGGGGTGQSAQGQTAGDAAPVVQKLVAQDLVQVRPFSRVQIQDFSDEVAGGVRDGHVFGKRVRVHPDLLVSSLHIGRFERRFAQDQRVANNYVGYIITPSDQTSTS